MKPIVATAAITLEGVTIAPAAPPHTYLAAAQSLMPGVELLAAASPAPALPLVLLSAQTLECLLKAYLTRAGSNVAVRAPKLRHNINALWAQAFATGLPIQETPPEWVQCLSRLHAPPYRSRYLTGVHGFVSPSPQPMVSELSSLVTLVRLHLTQPAGGL